MRKMFFGLILNSSLFLLLSCSTMPPDKPVCLEFSPIRAKCVNIISGNDFVVDESHKYEGKTWWELRPTNLSVPASTWAAIRSHIIKSCKKYGNCQQEVASWDRTIQHIDSQLEEKAPPAPPLAP